MKRLLFVLLVLASILTTVYVKNTKEYLDSAIKQQAESTLQTDTLFPARPVWWSDDKILAVGIVPGEVSGEEAAQKACELMLAEHLPIQGLRVEVYDVLKIQREDDWSLLGFAICE
jgi:hypothetical protein